MKGLRWFLFLLYVVLLVILLIPFLKGCVTKAEDAQEEVRRAETVGNNGDLKITLLWNFPADIDLHVVDPSGAEIYYRNKRSTSSGGALDVDNQTGGQGAAENIFWQSPLKGTYRVSLEYFAKSPSTDVVAVGWCTVIVFQKGRQPQKYRVLMQRVKERKSVVDVRI